MTILYQIHGRWAIVTCGVIGSDEHTSKLQERIRELTRQVDQGLAERDVLTKYVMKLEMELEAMQKRLEEEDPDSLQRNPLFTGTS